MTIQQLTVFLAVCEDMNYTRAAARTYMSRQAVRQNISELERELNGPLFNNYRNHLILTAKGVLLRGKAEPVVESFRELEKAMAADARSEAPLRLGISNSLIPDYLPRLSEHLASFAESYPNLPVQQQTLDNDEAADALLAGRLDACLLMDLNTHRPGLERTVLTEHVCGIFMKKTVPLFQKHSLSPSDLSGCHVFLPGFGEEFFPLFRAAPEADYSVMPHYYQVLFYIMEQNGLALNRYSPAEDANPAVARCIPLSNMPPLCSSFLVREGELTTPLLLLRDWLRHGLQKDFPPPADT
ncbi:MAG: LysR family transcriptional regulator [Oscillospiraceae bacterium]|nr:LysR family transcriptional regulator [Oscillospiraceae bacterium]